MAFWKPRTPSNVQQGRLNTTKCGAVTQCWRVRSDQIQEVLWNLFLITVATFREISPGRENVHVHRRHLGLCLPSSSLKEFFFSLSGMTPKPHCPWVTIPELEVRAQWSIDAGVITNDRNKNKLDFTSTSSRLLNVSMCSAHKYHWLQP